jgi:Fic family protein
MGSRNSLGVMSVTVRNAWENAAVLANPISAATCQGEMLSMDSVRSSVMRRLGLAASGPADRHVDGLVAVIDDATTAYAQPLDEDRLCRWQSALFPGGTSGIQRIAVGRYRDHDDPMQIVSGLPGREVMHYEAPPSPDVPAHMQRFLQWFAATAPAGEAITSSDSNAVDPLARAAIAHLWFESIHPFDDGNGRIGRAIVDMAVAQHLHQSVRLYSLSRQLLASHSGYYDSLNAAQRGDLDVTARVRWFARQCTAAYESASQVIDRALEKRHFWDRHEGSGLNERQRKLLQRLLDAGDDGFEGGTNADKYIKISANALRLIGVGRSAFMESAQAPAGQVAFSDLSLFRELQRIVHSSNVTGSLPAACVSRWMSCTGASDFRTESSALV